MKKILIYFLFTALSMDVLADNIPGMVISMTDGTTQSFSISEIRSIKFTSSQMVVNRKQGESATFSVDNVKVIMFSDVSTAVNSILGNASDASLLVTDLSGKVLYKGAKSGFSQNLHGIFLINGQKVAIK